MTYEATKGRRAAVTFHAPPELLTELARVAKAERRSAAALVRQGIRRILAEHAATGAVVFGEGER